MFELPKHRYRVSITPLCNMRCSYCHNEGNIETDTIMQPEVLYQLVEKSNRFGLKEIRLTGGEPTMHPQIDEICWTLKNKYHLKVSINTNLVRYDIVHKLLDSHTVDHIVVGMDYFDGPVSKNSTIGETSSVILQRVLDIKNKYKCQIDIAKVYIGDDTNTMDFVLFGITNDIRIKIIEIQQRESSHVFSLERIKALVKELSNWEIDEYGELNIYKNGNKVVSFFDSLCKSHRCDTCHDLQLRVSPSGIIRQCVWPSQGGFSVFDPEFATKMELLLS